MLSEQIVTVKLQRPIMSNDSMQAVMSYIVDENDENDEQTSNPVVEEMPLEDIKLLFGDHYKVYYLGLYRKGKPVELYSQEPTRQEDWV